MTTSAKFRSEARSCESGPDYQLQSCHGFYMHTSTFSELTNAYTHFQGFILALHQAVVKGNSLVHDGRIILNGSTSGKSYLGLLCLHQD